MGEVFDTSGLSDARSEVRGFANDLNAAASSARSRVSGEAEAAAQRIMGIRRAAAEERAAMDEADKTRRASMQANREAFDRERQRRAQVLGKAVDVVMGADPNAEENAKRDLENQREAARLQKERLATYQAEVAAVKERNRLAQEAADKKFEARKASTAAGLRNLKDQWGRRYWSDERGRRVRADVGGSGI